MTGTIDRAWDDWSSVWRADGPGGIGLAKAVKAAADRETTRIRVAVVAEMLVTVAVLGIVWWVAAAEGGASMLGWAVAAGLHTVVVWAFTLWNRIGVWKPFGRSTIDYIRITRERLERQRRSATFALWLAGAESVLLVGWFGLERRADVRWSWLWIPLILVTGSAIVSAVWAGRRVETALVRLRRVEAGLVGEGQG